MFEFGSGSLWLTPVSGNLAANPTPIEVGTLQDVSLDISFDLKMLYGQKQFPESIARGKGKITGKAKFGRFNSDLISQILFGSGGTRIAGAQAVQVDEPANLAGGNVTAAVIGASTGSGFNVGDLLAVTGGGGSGCILEVATESGGAISTFTILDAGTGYATTTGATLSVLTGAGTGAPTANITAAAATATYQAVNHSTAVLDLGVRRASTGVPLLKVASAPAIGQYSLNTSTWTYTFNVGDEVAMLVSYMNLAPVGGVTQQVSNQLMGTEPQCTIVFRTIFNGQEMIVLLYSAVVGKLTMASKLDDYTVPEVDFEAFANSAGKVIDIYAAE